LLLLLLLMLFRASGKDTYYAGGDFAMDDCFVIFSSPMRSIPNSCYKCDI
jgi:hypothetical protein